MQVTVEDQSEIKKILHIEIPAETVTRKLDDSYRQLKKTARIKGFRPGKAPVSMLKRLYKDKVHADVAIELIQTTLPEAVKEHSLEVIGEPSIDPQELKEEGPFTYNATVEIKPAIGDIDYSGLTLKKTKYQASEEEIENQINLFRKNQAEQKLIAEKRPAQADDIAVINFSGAIDGAPAANFEDIRDYRFTVGRESVVEGFNEQLLGMLPEETKSFDITFPQYHADSNLAGKTVSFTVTLTSLLEEILPEANDELAARMGPFETLDQLREEIRKHLQAGYDQRSQQEMNEQVFQALLNKCDFQVPEAMINFELEGIIREIEATYSRYNMSLKAMNQTHESLKEQYRETAIGQARRHIILNKIIDQEKLEVSAEDLQKGVHSMADAMRQPLSVVEQFYQKNPGQIDVLRYSLLEKAAMKKIIDSSTITEVDPGASASAESPETNGSGNNSGETETEE